jgi:hypothetical protein
LFKEAVSSLGATVSRVVAESSVIFALKRHLVADGQHATLYSQLAGVQGSGIEEVPATWLAPVLPVVKYGLGEIWANCKPPEGGKPSVRLLSRQLLQVQERCGLLPTVAKVVAAFEAGGCYDKNGMTAAIHNNTIHLQD